MECDFVYFWNRGVAQKERRKKGKSQTEKSIKEALK